MPLVPLELPPGAWRNGTEYEAKGRWFDTNLVRWRNNSLRPVGGWLEWSASDFTGIARGIHAWTDNSGDRWLALGTASKLYVYDDGQALHDITPTGLTAGVEDADTFGGYGEGDYGADSYGTPRPDTGNLVLASSWALDSWGEHLVGCMDWDGTIWEWQLDTLSEAAQVTNAPTDCIGLTVTAERILFALGAGGDPRQVDWCDQEDNTTWTPASTNQAGSYTLETDGEIRCGIQMRDETLILTSTDLWSARYIGQPLVYSFNRVGRGCGAPGNRTAVRLDNMAVWLGYGGFYVYDGYVRRIECDVWDHYLNTVEPQQASKIFGWHNTDHSEAWWFIPSNTTGECDFYICWNYVEGWWAFGEMDRSCAVGRAVFQTPMAAGTDQKVYQHEHGFDHGTETPYAESGPIEMGNGERVMHATMFYPDEQTLGETEVTFKTRLYPTADESTHGPFSMAEPADVRFSGRQAKMRVTATVEQDWRVGVPRLEVKPGGRR